MRRNISFLVLSFCLFMLMQSCVAKKEISSENYSVSDFREELLDTLFITEEENTGENTEKVYRSTAKQTFDLLHTKLDVKFNWELQQVYGKATLTVKPYFYPIDTIKLDAVNFDIHDIRLLGETNIPGYQYDGEKIKIKLPRKYTRQEKIQLYIDYTAKPEESNDQNGEAISSDKGLFFINPKGEVKNKPRQIWTQGETENNKKWFPTFDKPNERCSQEIFITVEDQYITLSNGKLISSAKNADGTRTDYWRQDLPHAPYLFMLAVGEFHEEKAYWNDIPLHYFVEKGFKKSASKIFNHTPEMMSFFSQKLQYPYPWDKYAQIVVRDFVSGAMENTSAVIFGEFVQKTDRELIDNDNDYIVAHELMHHWFGNLVTTEEWSNLTLNEGFANYAEYLWFEHKYGKERADYHRLTEMNGYFSQVYSQGAHPLVHYYYGNKEDMFDAHSYNKGGLVLHMLRQYTGDEAFFTALNKYLKDNAFSAVEVDELRMAFEDTIGEDLHWFFDQWFLQAGHPNFDVTYQYNEENASLTIKVAQTQDSIQFPGVFKMPLEIATYGDTGEVSYHSFFMDKRQQEFTINNLEKKPAVVVFDGKNSILGLIEEEKSQEEYIAQYRLSNNFSDKIIALSNITDKNNILDSLLREPFFFLRSVGVESVNEENYETYVGKIQEMAFFDPHAQVRTSALQTLLTGGEEELVPLLKRILESEQAYPVLGLAMEGLSYYDQPAAEKYAKQNMTDNSSYLINSLLSVFANSEDTVYLSYFHEKYRDISIYQLFDFFDKYQAYLENKSFDVWKKAVGFMFEAASNLSEDPYKKFFCANILLKINEWSLAKHTPAYDSLAGEINALIQILKTTETDPMLKQRYEELESKKP